MSNGRVEAVRVALGFLGICGLFMGTLGVLVGILAGAELLLAGAGFVVLGFASLLIAFLATGKATLGVALGLNGIMYPTLVMGLLAR